jgi:hypothetical protein
MKNGPQWPQRKESRQAAHWARQVKQRQLTETSTKAFLVLLINHRAREA